MAINISDYISTGVVGEQNWIYKNAAPWGFSDDYIGSYHGTVSGALCENARVSDEEYLTTLYEQYWDINSFESFKIKSNHPKTSIKSYKLAAQTSSSFEDPATYRLYYHDGYSVREVTFAELIPCDESGNVITGYSFANIYMSIYRDDVNISRSDTDTVWYTTHYNDDNNLWSSSIPLFVEGEGDITGYLQSPDPDPTSFGGFFRIDGEESSSDVDPSTPGNEIDGLFTDLGYKLDSGPIRAIVLSESEITHLGKIISSGWFSGKVGDAIIDLKCIRTPGTIATGESQNIFLQTPTITTLTGKYVTSQFQDFSFGEYAVQEKYNSFLDYNNSTVSIYLPFSGVHQLDTKSVIGSTIKISCAVDYITGNLTWYISITRDGVSQVLYEFDGNCSMSMPLTALDYGQKVTQFLSGVAGITTSLALGGFAANSYMKAATTLAPMMEVMAINNRNTYDNARREFSEAASQYQNALKVGGSGLAAGAASIMASTQNNFISIGTLQSNYGWTGIMYPFLIFSRSIPAYPEDYGKNYGFPCMKNLKLGDLTGLTIVGEIHLDGIDAYEEEKIELYDLLKSGVIL